MKNPLFNIAALVGMLLLICGCHSTSTVDSADEVETPTVDPLGFQAVHVDQINVDGRLDEAVWQDAPVYELTLSRDRLKRGERLAERGQVRFAWNDQYLFVAFDFVDSDVVAENPRDDVYHYDFGDVAELFVKPAGQTWYWEFYVTPRGNQTDLFFPGRGRVGLRSAFEYDTEMRVAAHVQGTLNEWQDRDEGWTAEMAIPTADLTRYGARWEPGADWHVLIGRYNYSRYFGDGRELSAAPTLSVTSFHQTDQYVRIELRSP